MVPHHFDTLVTSLALAGTRRGIVRLAAALPLAGLLPGWRGARRGLGVEEAAARKKNKKRKRKKKKKGQQTALCDPPCPVCQTCRDGACVATNQGQPCGTSTHGGTTRRCCNGACPDPDCAASDVPGAFCVGAGQCAAVACCIQLAAGCVNNSCTCSFAISAGDPCGSDQDCSLAVGARVCICGACQPAP